MASFYNAWLVDDDPTATFITEQFLRLQPLAQHIRVFHDPLAALEQMNNQATSPSNHPDLLLLDISMPLMTGFEFLDALLSSDKLPSRQLVVFMLSSSLDPADVARARQYPLSGYLQKPLREHHLQRILYGLERAP